MNRRNFFRSIALLGSAASISPQIFIPRFEPVRWKPVVATWHRVPFWYHLSPEYKAFAQAMESNEYFHQFKISDLKIPYRTNLTLDDFLP